MARNMNRDYIRKLINTEAPNGYRFDLANYLHNPSYDCDYPAFFKQIAETETTQIIRRVYYFKHYDGTGEYIEDIHTRQKSGGAWQIVKQEAETVLERSNRFSVKKLLSFCGA